jgi:hypothetical protein
MIDLTIGKSVIDKNNPECGIWTIKEDCGELYNIEVNGIRSHFLSKEEIKKFWISTDDYSEAQELQGILLRLKARNLLRNLTELSDVQIENNIAKADRYCHDEYDFFKRAFKGQEDKITIKHIQGYYHV